MVLNTKHQEKTRHSQFVIIITFFFSPRYTPKLSVHRAVRPVPKMSVRIRLSLHSVDRWIDFIIKTHYSKLLNRSELARFKPMSLRDTPHISFIACIVSNHPTLNHAPDPGPHRQASPSQTQLSCYQDRPHPVACG